MSENLLTAEQFADQKLDLPDSGRWTELSAGKLISFQPPNEDYGNIVRNLTLAFSQYAHAVGRGYACYELGIITRRRPDSVRCPPVCYILAGEQFAELDNLVSSVTPVLVVEIASTNDRRQLMPERVQEYLAAQIPLVWVVDPHARSIHIFEKDREAKQFRDHQTFFGGSQLDGFRLAVKDLFAEPQWWGVPQKNGSH